jgi:riboflavin synthase
MIIGCTHLSSTIFEYIISDVFIHFDEENDELRKKVLVTLKHATKVNPKYMLEKAKGQLKKMKHTSICEELIEYCEEALQDE